MTPEQRDDWSTDGPYYDADGNECTLISLCRQDPEWAAFVIHMLKAYLRLASTAPPWTSEVPTVAGWYWWRRDSTVEMMKVGFSNGASYACRNGDAFPMWCNSIGGQWSGPIPEPQEEHQTPAAPCSTCAQRTWGAVCSECVESGSHDAYRAEE